MRAPAVSGIRCACTCDRVRTCAWVRVRVWVCAPSSDGQPSVAWLRKRVCSGVWSGAWVYLLSCSCSFSELALVKLRLAEVDGLVLDEQFTANGVDLLIALGDVHLAALQQQLADISRGRILLQTR